MNKLFTVLIFSGSIMQLTAQTDSSGLIEINPFGINVVPLSFKLHSTVKFKINNVNTFLLSGDLSSKSTTIDFAVPEIFKPVSAENTKDAKADNDPHHDQPNNFVLPNPGKAPTPKELEEARKKLEAEKQHADSLIGVFKEEFAAFVTEYNGLHQYMALEDKLKAKLQDSLFIRDTATLKQNAADDYYAIYEDRTSAKAKMQASLTLGRLTARYAALAQIYDELNKTLEKDSVLVNGILKSSEGKSTVEVKNAIIRQDRKKYFSEEMAYAKSIFGIITDVEKRNKIIKKAQDGIDLYNQLIKETFVAYSGAQQLNDDIVTITPKLTYANGKLGKEFPAMDLRTSGGWKVNFSSGYMLSFVGDDHYGLLKDSAGATIGAVKTNDSKLTHALGGFIHAYPRWSDPNLPQIAASGGISMTTGGNIGFYGGLSVMFLEKNRLVFTAGYSYVKVKRLNAANLNSMENNRYQFRSTSDNTINYDEVYRGAFFLGLTYNLK